MNRKIKRIIILITFLCVSGGIIYITNGPINSIKNGVTSFQDITRENIGNGIYIDAQLDYISDSYMQTLKEEGVEQRKYYLLPLGDGTLATIEVKEEYILNAEKILDYSYYLDGYIEESAVENIAEVAINWKGNAVEMTDEMIGIFNKAFKDWGYTDEQIEDLRTPYIIQYSEPIGVAILHSVGLALGLTSLLLLIVVIVKKENKPKKKRTKQKTKKRA